jgi:hypothetical protein
MPMVCTTSPPTSSASASLGAAVERQLLLGA